MAVPLLDLAAHHEPLHTEIMAAIEQVFHSQAFILAPEVSKLEERVASYCQTRSAISRYDVGTFGVRKGFLGGSRVWILNKVSRARLPVFAKFCSKVRTE
jgi:phage host-nuclease inhibitor protein Gam